MTYFITFAIMTFTSIVTSTLTTKAKKSAADALERERESNALYQMTNHMTDAEDEDAIGRVTIQVTSEMLNGNTAYIFFHENGYAERTFLQRKDDGSIIRRELAEREEIYRRITRFTEVQILQIHSIIIQFTEKKRFYLSYAYRGKSENICRNLKFG